MVGITEPKAVKTLTKEHDMKSKGIIAQGRTVRHQIKQIFRATLAWLTLSFTLNFLISFYAFAQGDFENNFNSSLSSNLQSNIEGKTTKKEKIKRWKKTKQSVQNNGQPTIAEGVLPKYPSAPPSASPLKLHTSQTHLAPSTAVLQQRIEALEKHPEIFEPITLRLNTKDPGAILEQLAKPSISERLLTREGAQLKKEFQRAVLGRSKENKLQVAPKDLKWIDLGKLSSTLAQTSLSPSFQTKDLNLLLKTTAGRLGLEEHFQGYFWDLQNAYRFWQEDNPRDKSVPLEVLIPEHMRFQLGKYSPYRGRNCFATALNFNDANTEQNEKINIVREDGHYSALINNDEFLQALLLGYRELQPQEILLGLRYSDLVVFYDAADGPDSYQALKHAMVHIGGEVYLHKPSKSASTPIEFVKWDEVAQLWGTLAKNLGYKAFRRIPNGALGSLDSQKAIEKILWSN